MNKRSKRDSPESERKEFMAHSLVTRLDCAREIPAFYRGGAGNCQPRFQNLTFSAGKPMKFGFDEIGGERAKSSLLPVTGVRGKRKERETKHSPVRRRLAINQIVVY